MNTVRLLALMIMVTTQTVLAQDGNWRIERAQLPDGKSYNGSLHISRVGRVYGVDWKTSAGNYSGLGLLADGRLFVGYGLNSGYGIVVYKANPATQRLEGTWTASGLNGTTGTETLTGRDGNFDVVGTNPDGAPYRGKLYLKKTGDTFQAQWQVGNGTYNGVGFRSGDYLVIGYGPDQAFGTVEYVMAGNKARGRWAMGGGSQFGTEDITR